MWAFKTLSNLVASAQSCTKTKMTLELAPVAYSDFRLLIQWKGPLAGTPLSNLLHHANVRHLCQISPFYNGAFNSPRIRTHELTETSPDPQNSYYDYRATAVGQYVKVYLLVVVSNPLGAVKPTPSPFDISTKECHKPDPAHQTTVPGICPGSPKDQEKQEESRDRHRKTLPTEERSYHSGDHF
ncbi:hypothetical protein TNCV_3954901 [Trichonephila clavipes]|nr:hypothetical protein TNCV_3954901 [Trichonephila clavipes]